MEFSSSLAFLWGVFGALVVYFALYRQTRIVEAIEFKSKRRLVIFDLFGFLLCGGIIAAIGAETIREAFLIGSTWQGIAGGAASATERRLMREHIENRKESTDD